MTVQLSVDQVILIHGEQVNAGPLLDRGALEGAVLVPYQDVFGQELYPTVVLKAAKLVEGISRAQAFQDGNKRLAWLAGTTLLQVNGLFVQDVDPAEAANFVLLIGGDEVGLRAAARWLNEQVVALT